MLASAFVDDPVARHVEPDLRTRADAITRIFAALVDASDHVRTIRVVGTPVAAAAVWLTPQADAGEAGLFASLSLSSEGQRRRLGEAMESLDAIHAAAFSGPHLYLIFLGTAPESHGTGAGSALLESMHDTADAARLPCALEAFGDANRRFYERRGYEVVAVSSVSFSDETVHAMRRAAR